MKDRDNFTFTILQSIVWGLLHKRRTDLQ